MGGTHRVGTPVDGVRVNALSLFSGAGGMDLGLECAGITAVAHCEIDPKARSVLRRHWPDTPIVGDVRDVGPEWRGVDLVHGGFPCQDISVAGHRKGLDGARSGLWWEFHRILDELRPRWCVIENVAGLLSSNWGRDLGAILAALGELGYGFAYRVLDARHFGVPQRRRRVFIVGHLGGRGAAQVLLEPEGMRRDSAPRREAGQEVASLTANGVGTCGADDNQAQAGHLIPSHTGTVTANWSKGAGNTQVDEGHVIPVTFNGYNGIDVQPLTELTPTIRSASGVGMPQVLTAADLAVRRLTPRECERLMGWPDDWTRWDDAGAEIADSHRYRMCGNGVVASVAEWIGRRIVANRRDGGR